MLAGGCRPFRRSGIVAHQAHWALRVCAEGERLRAVIYNPQTSNGSPKDVTAGVLWLDIRPADTDGLHPVALARLIVSAAAAALEASYGTQPPAEGPAAPEGATGGACEGQQEFTFA